MEGFVQLLVAYVFLSASSLTFSVPNANSISSDNINVFLKNIVRFIFGCREVLGIHGQRLLPRNGRAWSVSARAFLLEGKGFSTRRVRLSLEHHKSHQKMLAGADNILHAPL